MRLSPSMHAALQATLDNIPPEHQDLSHRHLDALSEHLTRPTTDSTAAPLTDFSNHLLALQEQIQALSEHIRPSLSDGVSSLNVEQLNEATPYLIDDQLIYHYNGDTFHISATSDAMPNTESLQRCLAILIVQCQQAALNPETFHSLLNQLMSASTPLNELLLSLNQTLYTVGEQLSALTEHSINFLAEIERETLDQFSQPLDVLLAADEEQLEEKATPSLATTDPMAELTDRELNDLLADPAIVEELLRDVMENSERDTAASDQAPSLIPLSSSGPAAPHSPRTSAGLFTEYSDRDALEALGFAATHPDSPTGSDPSTGTPAHLFGRIHDEAPSLSPLATPSLDEFHFNADHGGFSSDTENEPDDFNPGRQLAGGF